MPGNLNLHIVPGQGSAVGGNGYPRRRDPRTLLQLQVEEPFRFFSCLKSKNFVHSPVSGLKTLDILMTFDILMTCRILKTPAGILVQRGTYRARLYLFSPGPRMLEVIIRENAESGPE